VERGSGALVTLLRTGDFRQQDAVPESFMRSSVVRENDDPIRFFKHFSVSVFLGAVLSAA